VTDAELRVRMFDHLRRLAIAHPEGIPSSQINDFTYDGHQQRLIVQPGIWKPKQLTAALTIRTTFTGSDAARPYEDEIGQTRTSGTSGAARMRSTPTTGHCARRCTNTLRWRTSSG
jgi:hypothetical protein